MDNLGLNFPSSRLIELKEELNKTIKEINRTLGKRKLLIEFNGYTDKQEQEINSKLNPEDYYKFRFFGYGCEIVYTHWTTSKETGMQYIDKDNFYYGIKYYGCKSKIFEDGRIKLAKYDGKIYGDFKNFDEARSYFKKAVIDILVQLGCIALNPLDFM